MSRDTEVQQGKTELYFTVLQQLWQGVARVLGSIGAASTRVTLALHLQPVFVFQAILSSCLLICFCDVRS